MRRAVSLAAVLLAAGAAAGADQWIAVSPPRPAPGDIVTLDLRVGEPWAGTQRAHDPATTILFQRLWKSGREDLAGTPGEPPLARFAAAGRPGVELIVYGARSRETEHSRRYGKAVIVVGDPPTGGELHRSEIGQLLEIVPLSDPVDLARAGGAYEVQVLWEREPLDGVDVYAAPESDPQGGVRVRRTDDIGVASLELDRPGRWLIGVAHRAPCDDCGSISPVRASATLTLVAGGE